MKADFEIKVPGTKGFVIKPNTIYTVVPKPDPNAPDGFKEHGTTKLIHPEIGNVVEAPYDVNLGVWDTGFYEYSPCLREYSPEEKKKFVKLVNEVIVKPVELIKGEGVLNHKNNEFYDEFVIPLYNKISFNSSDPMQLLGLYLAVLNKELCPSDDLGNPKFKKADFQVVNREKEISNKEQISIDKSRATGEFYKLLQTDIDKLQVILHYLKISTSSVEDEDTFIKIFSRFLEDKQDGYRNSKIFLDTIKRFSSKKGGEELFAYKAINALYDKKEVKLIKGEYFLREYNLGNSIKHAAAYVIDKPEILGLITELNADKADTDEE